MSTRVVGWVGQLSVSRAAQVADLLKNGYLRDNRQLDPPAQLGVQLNTRSPVHGLHGGDAATDLPAATTSGKVGLS